MMNRPLMVLCLAAAVTSCSTPPPTDLCKGRVEGDLVVTELMLDPDGVDTGQEWVEIFNTLGTPIDLKGMSIFTSDVAGGGIKTHVIKAGTVPARGYFVLGDVRSGPNPQWIGYTYGTSLGSLPNASGTVGIKCSTTTLAKFTWTTAGKPLRSRELDGALEPSSSLAASEANYCDTPATALYSGNNAGTPGGPNVVCVTTPVAGNCVDPLTGTSRPIVHPLSGEAIITEVMARPKAVSASNGEWVELQAAAEIDLNGLKLATANSSTTITSPDCIHLAAGEYALLARSGDAMINGNLPPVTYVYGSLAIPDTTQQTLTLSSPDSMIDQAVIYPSASGKAWQLDPLKLNTASNDSPDSFCVAPTQWTTNAGDYGSPGLANPACPVSSDPNVCFDDVSMASRTIRHPSPGDLVFTEWMASPTTPQADREYIEAWAKTEFDLNGVSLLIGSTRTNINSPTCLPVLANSYLLFGNNDDPLLNGGLPPLVASFTSSLTGTSVFSLLGSDGGVFDTITSSGQFAGASTQIAPGFEDPAQNDVLANRCRSPNRWSPDGGGDFGSPGTANPPCPVDAGPPDPSLCLDTTTATMRPIRVPADGTLVITEWMPNPAVVSDAAGEYLEVLTKSDADLNGLMLEVGTTPTTLASANCMPVTANSYLVFGVNANPALNGNLPPLTSVFSGSLNNTTQTVTILGADGGTYDAITYTGAGGTAAWPAGASMQVKPGFENPTDNDVTANLCVAGPLAQYGAVAPDGGLTGDRGTPGLPNVCP